MKRFHRWVLPATAVSAALVALLILSGTEVLDDAPPERVLPPSAPLVAAAPTAAPVVAAAPAPEPALSTPAAPVAEAPAVAEVAPAPAAEPPPREAPKARTSGRVEELARLDALGERLRAIDRLKETLGAEDAVATFSRLLDAELPGTEYEVQTLRLYILARLGELPGPRADAALVARLDPDRPRPQRLVAVDMLAARPDAGRYELEAVARNDHDTVVQERARWALARAR